MEMVINIENFKEYKNECGGKAYNLFKLHQNGIRVPKLIVIPPHILESEIIKNTNISNNISDDFITVDALENLRDNIGQSSLNHSDFYEKILEEVSENLDGPTYAVRSSINVEDSKQYSFAGIFESYINVSKDDLLEKIILCCKSVFTKRVSDYAKFADIPFHKIRPSIIIQDMVEASKSGILFTMNALGNYQESLVTAAFGYCEDIVQGKVDTELYFTDRQTQMISSMTTPKVLSHEEIQLIHNTGMNIEKIFNHPQDIEFSFDQNNQLYILQSRPITTIHPEKIKILDNSNIVESYPGITLPLSYTFAKSGYEGVFSAAAKIFGLSDKKINEIKPQLSEMITHVNGRIYYQLHNWYQLMGIILTDESSLKAWETLIGIDKQESKTEKSGFIKKIKNTILPLKLFLEYNGRVKKFYKTFDENYSQLRHKIAEIQTNKLSECEIMNWYKIFSKKMFESWAPTLLNDFFTFKFFDLLKKSVSQFEMNEEQLANDLLVGLDEVDSEQPILELLQLKNEIQNNEDLKNLFAKESIEIWKELANPAYQSFKEKIDKYIDLYGDRTLNELKLESLNYRLKPIYFIDLLTSQLVNLHNAETFKNNQKKISIEALEKIKSSLKYKGWKKIYFNFILKMAKKTLRNRENMRFRRAKAYGAVKEIFYHIGTKFEEKKWIENTEDIFYITLEELYESACGKNSLQSIITARKAEFSKYLSIEMPDRIIFENEIPIFKPTQKHIEKNKNQLLGLAISKGKVSASALVLHTANINAAADQKILVTQYTDPGWVFLMTRAVGIITEKGSPLSHTAIVGRELGIPVIVNVANATTLIDSGRSITMDGSLGIVYLT